MPRIAQLCEISRLLSLKTPTLQNNCFIQEDAQPPVKHREPHKADAFKQIPHLKLTLSAATLLSKVLFAHSFFD